jgi:hypothetical protein
MNYLLFLPPLPTSAKSRSRQHQIESKKKEMRERAGEGERDIEREREEDIYRKKDRERWAGRQILKKKQKKTEKKQE